MGENIQARYTLDGIDGLQAKFESLSRKGGKAVIRKSLRAGAKVIAAEVRVEAPVKSGAIKRAVKVRAGKGRKKGALTVLVSIGKKWFQGATFYGGFLAFGWLLGPRKPGKVVRIKLGGRWITIKRTGRAVPAKRFIPNAFNASRQNAANAIEQTMKTAIEAYAQKEAAQAETANQTE